LPLEKVIDLIYSYAYDDSYESAMHETWNEVDGTDVSTATIADYYNYCREAIIYDFVHGIGQRGKIGGPGKIVEIDESKVGVQKYNKGRRALDPWND